MKKAWIAISFALVVSAAGWYVIHKSSIFSSEVRKAKSGLQAYSDSMDVLDMKIQELLRKEAESEEPTVQLGALKKEQQVLWQSYKALREEIALLIEEKPSLKISRIFFRIIGRLGPFYSAGAAVLILVVTAGIILRKRAGGDSSSGQEALSRAEPEKMERPFEGDVSNGLPGALRVNDAYSKNRVQDKVEGEKLNNQEGGAGSGIQKSPDGFGEEFAVSVPVCHLAEDASVSRESKNPESSLASAAPGEDPVQPLKTMSPDSDRSVEKGLAENRGLNSPGWDQYERERMQKAAVVKLARRGSTSSEIAKRLNISQDEVEFFIRDSRENG